MENNDLRHHGVVGMKWGIRRYQNKNGTLTNAGKKRYAKEMAKLKEEQKVINNKKRTQAKMDKLADMRKHIDEQKKELNGSNPVKKLHRSKSQSETSQDQNANAQPKKRTIKDLSDEELNQRVNRMRMENAYIELAKARQPEQAAKGKSFLKEFNDGAIKPAAINAGKTLLTNFLVKKGSKMLGIDEKSVKSARDALKDEVEDLKLRKEKATIEDYFKKRSEKQSKSEKSSKQGSESTSEKKETTTEKESVHYKPYTIFTQPSGNSSAGNTRKKERVVYDAEWEEVTTPSSRESGSSYVTSLLGSGSSNNRQLTSSNVSRGENFIAGLLPEPRDRD